MGFLIGGLRKVVYWSCLVEGMKICVVTGYSGEESSGKVSGQVYAMENKNKGIDLAYAVIAFRERVLKTALPNVKDKL